MCVDLLEVSMTITIDKECIEKEAKIRIWQAVRYPERARLAVESIISDICDRGGMKHLWGDIDADIRYEIVETWVKIIDIIFDSDFDVNELLEERKKELEKPRSK